jgi:hypothetical protein
VIELVADGRALRGGRKPGVLCNIEMTCRLTSRGHRNADIASEARLRLGGRALGKVGGDCSGGSQQLGAQISIGDRLADGVTAGGEAPGLRVHLKSVEGEHGGTVPFALARASPIDCGRHHLMANRHLPTASAIRHPPSAIRHL